ncbi:hypothetical protein GCM10023190_23300 [Enteractinococcus fodinae]|uniref:ABC-2 type transport system permease protein n=1 Tax=Enteractinococcus fodinae TaxID=684663 RepID=A0ABU2B2S3_9MICC|nr:ABC transporter permease [Enteractinococcus fodinae]MDR7347908.1 ABC-2 type transport system permease protein [Enteractinococcus fodinae]
MKALRTALYVELRKARASRVLHLTAILLMVGITILAIALTISVNSGDEQVLAKLGPLADTTGWLLLIGITAQVIAAGGLLAIGIAMSWMFGREFTDGTISGLFALPVPRSIIALAKLGVLMLWVVAVSIGLTALILVSGLALNLGPLTSEILLQLGRLLVLVVLTGLLTFPAAWVATLGRGPLPGIAATVVVLVIAQVTVIAAPDSAAWFPLSAPALWAIMPEAVHLGQLATVVIVPALFAVLTALSWQRLQLHR